MNNVSQLMNKASGVMNGADAYTKIIMFALGFVFFVLVFWWLWRVAGLTEEFLKNAKEVLGASPIGKNKSFIFYKKEELKGTYKGREVVVGVLYAGLKGEFMPLPYIGMKLREVMGYNTNRLPHYVLIEHRILVYKAKLSVLYGVFDRNYPHVFSKNYLLIALEKLLSTAEDVERGQTVREIFK